MWINWAHQSFPWTAYCESVKKNTVTWLSFMLIPWVANVTHSTPLFQRTTLKNRTHSPLDTGILSCLTNVPWSITTPPACPHDQTAISGSWLARLWPWDTVTLYDEVCAGSHGKWTCDFDFICTCSVTGQSEQSPVKTAGSRDTSRMHRTRRKMVLTAGQQEQQLAPHLSCHQPLILWFLQYLLCHPSNCWLVWNSSPFN